MIFMYQCLINNVVWCSKIVSAAGTIYEIPKAIDRWRCELLFSHRKHERRMRTEIVTRWSPSPRREPSCIYISTVITLNTLDIRPYFKSIKYFFQAYICFHSASITTDKLKKKQNNIFCPLICNWEQNVFFLRICF